MAWSSASIPAREQTAYAADKPLLLCANELREASSVQWRNALGIGAGASLEDTDYPVARLYDGFTDALSKTTSTAVAFLNIDRGAGTLADFDCVALLNHDYGGVTVTLQVIIADSSDFLTNQDTILSTVIPAGVRHLYLDLDTFQRYSDTRYVCIKLSKAAPQVYSTGEIFLGKRIQLEQVPMIGWDPSQARSNVADFKSRSGKTTRYVLSRGQRLLNAQLEPYETAPQADVQRIWDESYQGTRQFLWCDLPSSAPDAVNLMTPQTEWGLPWQGPFRRTAVIEAEEQGPNFLALDS